MHLRNWLQMLVGMLMMSGSVLADDFAFKLQSQKESRAGSGMFEAVTRKESWAANQTAVIVCDVWDLHHCLNAVRRLEEFAPRMNDVLKEARQRGATIIHAPSDCMPAYEDHPARKRAITASTAQNKPRDVEFWCSQIPAEEKATYPIDQSDGGEDDDPAEHAEWAAKLKAMGRNPGTPWKTQSPLIEIDGHRDFISDRGDEVWNILEARGLRNVILVGVHTNMCVLGRPFGLRQMARNGKRVVLMRDMTDCMYNPKRWPYVDHFSGNDLVIAHVERFVCPTITSDQLLGGEPFRSKYDKRTPGTTVSPKKHDPAIDWTPISLPGDWSTASSGTLKSVSGTAWYRCTLRLPERWIETAPVTISWSALPDGAEAWLNGEKLKRIPDRAAVTYSLAPSAIIKDDINLLVVRIAESKSDRTMDAPRVKAGDKTLPLEGRWELRTGNDPAWSNIPLPAKFGGSPEILFEPRD